jgi:hypothetical protein
MQKKRGPRRGLRAVGLMAGILVLAGCSDVLQGPSESLGSSGEGCGMYNLTMLSPAI